MNRRWVALLEPRILDRREVDLVPVASDPGLLAEHGIVTFDTDGRSKSPRLGQEHVVVEPIV